MGNTVSNQEGVRSGNVLHWHFGRDHLPISPANNTAEAATQEEDSCLIRCFLASIGLSIYADAFLLAGYGSSSAASLAALTAADLARVQAVSKMPILPQHQEAMFSAIKDFAETLAAGDSSPTASPGQRPKPWPAANAAKTAPPAATAVAGSSAPPHAAGHHAHSAPEQQQQQQQLDDLNPASTRAAHLPCPLITSMCCSQASPCKEHAASTAVKTPATSAVAPVADSTADPKAPLAAADASGASDALEHSTVQHSDTTSSQSGLSWARCAALLKKRPARRKAAARSKATAQQTPTHRSSVGAEGHQTGSQVGPQGSNSMNIVPSEGHHAGSQVLPQGSSTSRLQMASGQHCPSPAAANKAAAAAAGNAMLSAELQQQAVESPSTSLQQPAKGSLLSRIAAICDATPAAAANSSNNSRIDQNMPVGSSKPQLAADAAAAAASALTPVALLLDRATTEQTPALHAKQQQLGVLEHLVDAMSPAHVHYVLPGLSEIEPDDTNPFRQQAQPAKGTAGDVAGQPSVAAAAAAAAAEGYWPQDLQQEHGCVWDDSNPFLTDDLQPVALQDGCAGAAVSADHGYTKIGCELAPRSPACAIAVGAVAAGGEAGQGAYHSSSTYGAAVVPAACGATQRAAGGGPLMSQRSQLLRPSSRAAGGPRVLSNAAVTAAAAAKLAGRRKPASAWEKLPGDIKGMSYAATASLKTHPLPALAAVASGRPCKSRIVDAEPGALTVNACQLPSRPASESGFSMQSQRYPGLRAEESAANASAALQQLAKQQASNQQLILRLLQAPTAGAGTQYTQSEVGEFVDGPGAGPEMGEGSCIMPQGSALLLPEGSVLCPPHSLLLVQQQQQPQLYAQYTSSSGGGFLAPVTVAGLGGSMGVQQQQLLVLTQQGLAIAAPGAAAAQGLAVASGVLQLSEPSAHQQQHSTWQTQHQGTSAWQGAADYRDSSAHWQQRQQGTVMHGAQHGYVPASAQHSPVVSGSHSLYGGLSASHMPAQGVLGSSGAPYRGHMQQQVLHVDQGRGVFLQERSSASVGGACFRPAPGSMSGAQSCIELGARAADVSSIVMRAKAKAAAKQQQQLERMPVTSESRQEVSGSLGRNSDQPRGAAAMHASAPRVDASAAACDTTAAAGATSGSSLAAAVRDGDRVLQILQECKELSELDKAVKCRMMQLMHHTAVHPGAQGAHQVQNNKAAGAAMADTTLPTDAAGAFKKDAKQYNLHGGADLVPKSQGQQPQEVAVAGFTTVRQGAGAKAAPEREQRMQTTTQPVHKSQQEGRAGVRTEMCAPDAPVQSSRMVGDQSPARLLQGVQHKQSPARVHGQAFGERSMQSDQKYNARNAPSTHHGAAVSAAARVQQQATGGAGAGLKQQDACPASRSAARQLLMEDPPAVPVPAAAAATRKLARTPAASTAAASGAGMARGGDRLSMDMFGIAGGLQHADRASVAALVAAVAARSVKK